MYMYIYHSPSLACLLASSFVIYHIYIYPSLCISFPFARIFSRFVCECVCVCVCVRIAQISFRVFSFSQSCLESNPFPLDASACVSIRLYVCVCVCVSRSIYASLYRCISLNQHISEYVSILSYLSLYAAPKHA